MSSSEKSHRVLVVNTGGTIAMVHADNDPLSPLVPGDWHSIIRRYPLLRRLPFDTEIRIFDPLLDSSDMGYDNWRQLAEIIEESYEAFDGFVILHGTDTMCNTASALSFMLENLAKPVVLTGSQLPLAKPRSDALENFVTALSIAAGQDVNDGSELETVPEVCILFRGKLLRGNRARKLSASAYGGFESPNYGELGRVGERIEIDSTRVRRPPSGEFFTSPVLNTNVMVLDVIPSLDPEHLKAATLDLAGGRRAVDGLVLKTFGAGNVPRDPAFLAALGEIVGHGVVVVDVTQCPQGMVEIGRYQSSAPLLDLGVASGVDMTPEAALGKLMWLLGKGWPHDEVVRQLQIDQRGEQSLDVHAVEFGAGEAAPVARLQQRIPGDLSLERLHRATLRLGDVATPDGGEIRLSLFLNHDGLGADTGDDVPQSIGQLAGRGGASPRHLLLKAGDGVRRLLRAGQIASLGVVSRSGRPVSWRSLTLTLHVRSL